MDFNNFWFSEKLRSQIFIISVIRFRTVPRKFLKSDPGAATFRISYNLVALVIFHGCISPSFRPTQKLVVITRGAELVNPSWSFLFVRDFESTLNSLWKTDQLNIKNQFFEENIAEERFCVHKRLRNWCFSASQIQMILGPILTENDSKNRDP